MRTLIVDDSTARFLLQEMIAHLGSNEVAANGEEGLRAFLRAHAEGAPYDLILLDVMMPIMDGLTALQEIRKQEEAMGINPMSRVRIIMVTASNSPETVRAAYSKNHHADGYLVKPVDKFLVMEVIRSVMSSSRDQRG